MALSQGARLGHYEIVAPLGAGGMGEVYRARDDRIGRDVALKVLPGSLVQNEDRLRRFEQEARAAGRLNHPNVVTVHDVGQDDGLPYVVSELLEGETLRERLGASGLSVRKATEIAVQIARGLGAAHEQGIVHRDLKPENVFVTKDGQVKILDFGLAKLTRAEAPLEAESQLRTEGYETDPGTVMGTAGYMSPEQVRGRPVDHRSDIFSLGAILYEMLSGRRAFARDSSVETLNAILKEDPPELSGTGRPIPPALDRIVRHCLEKSPDERFASARDLAFDLQSLSDAGASGPLDPRPRARRQVGIAVAALCLVALGAVPAFLLARSKATPAPTYSPLTFRRGQVTSAVFAPDGKTIFYSALWDGNVEEVFVAQPGALASRALGVRGQPVGIVQDELAIYSATRWRDGTLVKVPVQGGVARPFLEHLAEAFASSDGSALGIVRRGEQGDRLELPIGTVIFESTGDVGTPRLSPDRERVAFGRRPVFGFTSAHIAVVETKTRAVRDLTGLWDNVGGIAWSPDGSEIWYTASVAGSMDGEMRAVSLAGRDRLVARLPGSLRLFDIARDGRVLLAHEKHRFETRGRLPGEATERDLSWFDRTYQEDLTPDGKTMVFVESGRGGGARQSSFLRSVDGSPAVRLSDGMVLALSPDAQWTVVTDVAPGLLLTPTGAGEPRPLRPGTIAVFYDAWWFADGKRLLIAGEEPGRLRRLFIQELPDGEPKPVTPEGIATPTNTLSPDEKWVAASGSEAGAQFALYPLAGGEPRPILGLEPREIPVRWSSDGRSLFVWLSNPDSVSARIVKLDLATGRRSAWLDLAPADPAGLRGIADVLLSADGRGYTYSYPRRLGDLYLVEGLR
jgi:hypothetical protein